jgi:outer membrane receptor protein involved in Fe transport
MLTFRRSCTLAVVASLTGSPVLLMPTTGWAQVEEIIVTTRKREESLQEVPIAVNAISAADIDRKAISGIGDITKGLASVEFDEGASKSDTRITIRGLSPTRGRQNVAVLVDGIDVSTEAISSSGGGLLLNTRLVDIERIEVVKGPQMALYGRSAFAGAIQYITKDPSDEFESTVSMDANGDDQYSATLGLSGPVYGDKLGLRFNAAVWDEPGFYDNTITGDSLGDDEGFGLALTAKSQLTDSFSLKFRAEYQDQQTGPAATAFLGFNAETQVPTSSSSTFTDPNSGIEHPALFRCFQKIASKTWNAALVDRNDRLYDPNYTPTGPTSNQPNPVLYSSPYCETGVASFTGAPGSFNKSDIAVAPDPFTNDDYEGVDRQLVRLSLIGEWELERGTMTLRSGYIQEDADESADNGKYAFTPDPASISPLTGGDYLDGNPNAFTVDTDKTTTQFSQELMYRTNFDGPTQVTVGALYWNEEVDNDTYSMTLQGSGSHCAWLSGSGLSFDENDMFMNPPRPDLVGTSCYGYSERAVAPLARGGFNYTDGNPYNGIQGYMQDAVTPADRDTDHRSLFGMVEYEFTSSIKGTFEGRYSVETVDVTGPLFLDPNASGGPGSWVPCGIFFRPCDDSYLFGQYGPFYSQANFEDANNGQQVDSNGNYTIVSGNAVRAGTGYDIWAPDYLFTSGPLKGNTYRSAIPATCLADPAVQQRLATFDAGGGDPFDMFNPSCRATISRDDSWFSPKLTLSWQVNDDLNTYASWSRAEKPGGFSTLGIGGNGINRELLEYEPEKLMVWEIGAKSQWLDRTLILNTSFFFQDFTDKQTLVSVLNSVGDRLVNKLENVDGAEVYGLELEATWAPEAMFLGGNWQFNGAYTWLDAEYVDAEVENTSFTFIAAAGNCRMKELGPQTTVCMVSLDGKKLEDAPEGKFTGSIAYNLPLAEDLSFFAETDFMWVAKRYIEATNENWVESDTNVDLRLGLRGDNWEVTGYVTNVLDDDTVASMLGGPSLSCCFILGSGIDIDGSQPPADDPGGDPSNGDQSPYEPGKTVTVELPQFRAAFAPDPRVIGIRARYRFGGSE